MNEEQINERRLFAENEIKRQIQFKQRYVPT
jgi:hypothetical protein